MCITVSNELKYCACLYVYNVLYVYNCIHEQAIKPSCILYLVTNLEVLLDWVQCSLRWKAGGGVGVAFDHSQTLSVTVGDMKRQ